MIYIGSDHKGFELKEKLVSWFEQESIEFSDLGAFEHDPDDDYTVFAAAVGKEVSQDENVKGIIICGSGVGVNIVANKFENVRASLGINPEQVKKGRSDDDMNVLVLAADFTNDALAKEMVEVFINTDFSGEDRFIRRLREIENLELNN